MTEKIKKFLTNKQETKLLWLIIFVATVIRVLIAINWQGLSFDEIVSVTVAQKPLANMWQYLQWEMHPPLHFYYLHYWLKLFGDSDAAIRLSSVILGVLSIIATYFLSKELFQKKLAGIYGAFLSSQVYITLVYSLIARMYILFYLLSTLSFYLLLKTINSKGRSQIIYGGFYGLITLLALYTHLTALVIPFIQIIYLGFLYYKKSINKNFLKKIIWLNVVVIIFYLPWFISFIVNRLSNLGHNAWYTFTEAESIFFLSTPIALLVGSFSSQIIALFLSLLFLVILFFVMFKVDLMTENKLTLSLKANRITLLALLIIYIPMTALFLLDLNSLRFYILPVVGLIMLITQALLSITQKKYLLLTLGVILAIYLSPPISLINLPDYSWPQIAEFIEEKERPGDKIVSAYSAHVLSLQYYYQGELPIDAFADPDIKAEAQDDLELVMRTNAIIYVNDETIEDFGELVSGHDRIFFLFSNNLFGNTSRYFTEWFIEQGWQKIDGMGDENYTSPAVWILEKI